MEDTLPQKFSVNLSDRPSKITIENKSKEMFLRWDSTIDDSGRIRNCIICGHDLYKEQPIPRVTGIVVILAFAGGIAGVVGFPTTWSMFAAMGIVLILDGFILMCNKPRLVCYGCGTKFKNTPISPHFHRWDQQKAEQVKRSLG